MNRTDIRRYRTAQSRVEWFEKHKDSDVMVLDITTGDPLSAHYYTDLHYLKEQRMWFAALLRSMQGPEADLE